MASVDLRSRTAATAAPPGLCGCRRAALAAAILGVAFQGPAGALVGGAQIARGQIAYHVVMISGARGTFCSGTLIAPDIVLTAAHCTTEAAAGLTVSRSAEAGPARSSVVAVAVHPSYNAGDYARSRAAVDLAMLKLDEPLSVPQPIVIHGLVPLPGERLVVAGFGVTAAGSHTGLGTLQTATLAAVGEPSSLQLRLADPASQGGAVPGIGSCDGDSGGPVFEPGGGRLVLIGVMSWSNGPGWFAGCGGVTGVTPLARHREWIVRTTELMGRSVNYMR
jgi:secreted trypsin-like serine protease